MGFITKPSVINCPHCGGKVPLPKRKPKSTFKTTKVGARSDLDNISFRSGWEADYARYLNYLKQEGKIVRWYYESKRFNFPTVKRGATSYLPDFNVIYPDGRSEWHEVKGYWTGRGKTCVNRFRKYYPNETLVIIERPRFNEIKKQYADKIPNWES